MRVGTHGSPRIYSKVLQFWASLFVLGHTSGLNCCALGGLREVCLTVFIMRGPSRQKVLIGLRGPNQAWTRHWKLRRLLVTPRGALPPILYNTLFETYLFPIHLQLSLGSRRHQCRNTFVPFVTPMWPCFLALHKAGGPIFLMSLHWSFAEECDSHVASLKLPSI